MKYTKEEFAALLTGRSYGAEISGDEERQARESGLVVVFGYSDDNMELRGAIHDEIGCYDGGRIAIDEEGVAPSWEDKHECKNYPEAEKFFRSHFNLKRREIVAAWGKDNYSWIYRTDIPHATFEIVEGDEKFCRGIVFYIAEIK